MANSTLTLLRKGYKVKLHGVVESMVILLVEINAPLLAIQLLILKVVMI
jgi:hypothetical protein